MSESQGGGFARTRSRSRSRTRTRSRLESTSGVACLHALFLLLAGAGALQVQGCFHVIEPTDAPPLRLEEDEQTLLKGSRVRLENGYAEAEMRRLREDGIHRLDVNLREWTARLLLELERDLEARGAEVHVDWNELRGTALDPLLRAAREEESCGARFPLLRAAITAVVPPDFETGAGALLSATLAAPDGSLSAVYDTGTTPAGFAEAFLDLKKQMIGDERLRAWLRGSVGD